MKGPLDSFKIKTITIRKISESKEITDDRFLAKKYAKFRKFNLNLNSTDIGSLLIYL